MVIVRRSLTIGLAHIIIIPAMLAFFYLAFAALRLTHLEPRHYIMAALMLVVPSVKVATICAGMPNFAMTI
jgi:hypothetical protein